MENMQTNQTLQFDVQHALKEEPLLKAAHIGVTVEDGIVVLTGAVDSYVKKVRAEDVVKNVIGVKAIVEKIEIRLYSPLETRDDCEIASNIVNAIERDEQIPPGCVKIKVEDGWVTLEGELPLNSQKEAVRKAVGNLFDIKGITDSIAVKAETQDALKEKVLRDTFQSNASVDAREIEVNVSDKTITLFGTVVSGYEKSEAGRIAWNMPGVKHVEKRYRGNIRTGHLDKR